MRFRHHHTMRRGNANMLMMRRYSYMHVQEVVHAITTHLASFWERECQDVKESLSSVDRTGTGRVSLSDFYGANLNGEWRFAESEQYLREVGALDESSTWHGKQ